jgi:hypothetical protein
MGQIKFVYLVTAVIVLVLTVWTTGWTLPIDGGDTCTSSAFPDKEDVLRHLENVNFLFVMDPNCELCYEEVGVDGFTNETLLHWVYRLTDALTATPTNPEGQPLQVRSFIINIIKNDMCDLDPSSSESRGHIGIMEDPCNTWPVRLAGSKCMYANIFFS